MFAIQVPGDTINEHIDENYLEDIVSGSLR